MTSIPGLGWLFSKAPGEALLHSYLAVAPVLLCFYVAQRKTSQSKKIRLSQSTPPDDLLYRFQSFRDKLRAPDVKLAYFLSKGTRGPAIWASRNFVYVLEEHLNGTPETEQDFALAFSCIQARGYVKKDKVLILLVIPVIVLLLSAVGAISFTLTVAAYGILFVLLSVFMKLDARRERDRCFEAIESGTSPEAAVAYLSRYFVSKSDVNKESVVKAVCRKYAISQVIRDQLHRDAKVAEKKKSSDPITGQGSFDWMSNLFQTTVFVFIWIGTFTISHPHPWKGPVKDPWLLALIMFAFCYFTRPLLWNALRWIAKRRKPRPATSTISEVQK